jgi:hypothetical protein
VEIKCPPDCGYLASAREHPAAVVRRRQERDVEQLLPTIRHLTERQYQLFFLFHTMMARYTPQGFSRLVDADVADAAAAVAATLETAARGVIYEHTPQGPPAQALAIELKTMLAKMREQGAKVFDGEAAIVLRAMEQGARGTTVPMDGPTGYLDLVARLLQVTGTEKPAPEAAPASQLILP